MPTAEQPLRSDMLSQRPGRNAKNRLVFSNRGDLHHIFYSGQK
jgi:hypothetical protein